MNEKIKLLILTPVYDSANRVYAQSLERLKQCSDFEVFDIQFQSSSVSHGRNFLWHQAIPIEADFILWIDSDMEFEVRDVWCLVELLKGGRDIATGFALTRAGQELNIFTGCDEHAQRIEDIPPCHFSVDSVGMAFLMHTKNLMRDYENECRESMGAPFDLLPTTGKGHPFGDQLPEDISFCKRMGMWGKKIWVHPDARIGHLMSFVLRPKPQERNMTTGGFGMIGNSENYLSYKKEDSIA